METTIPAVEASPRVDPQSFPVLIKEISLAARLDPHVYQAARDPETQANAIAVVFWAGASSAFTTIGILCFALWVALVNLWMRLFYGLEPVALPTLGSNPFLHPTIGLAVGTLVWLVQARVLATLSRFFFSTPATYGFVARALAFGTAPGILGFLYWVRVPVIPGVPISLIAGVVIPIWIWAAQTVAVRETFQTTTGRAFGVLALSNLLFILLGAVAGGVYGLLS